MEQRPFQRLKQSEFTESHGAVLGAHAISSRSVCMYSIPSVTLASGQALGILLEYLSGGRELEIM